MKYNPITVTDLNKYIKEKISDDEYLNSVLVKGEIYNGGRHIDDVGGSCSVIY